MAYHEDDQKVGMNYEWAKEKLIKNKMPRINPNCRKALLENVKLQEGEQAAQALDIETRQYYKGPEGIESIKSRSYSGAGNRQCGWGDGKNCSEIGGFKPAGPGIFVKKYS